MLKSFRSFTKSRYGLIAVFVFLAVIAFAFAASDITGMQTAGTTSRAGTVAKVGGTAITDAEVRDRIDRFIRSQQREGRTVTMEQFLDQGGLELTIDDLINSAAMLEFAQKSGMNVSKRLIDGEIASTPAFQGFDGKFDQNAFQRWMGEQRISPASFYDQATRDRYGNWLVNRASLGLTNLPQGIALPYASLELERRRGVVGFIQTAALDAGAMPDDKALAAYYAKNQARYMVPQRRVIRYAPINLEALKAQSAATEAEIAAAYKGAAAKYAAAEKRTIDMVTALDQATAAKVATAAKAGTLDAAARAAGLQARAFAASEKAAVASGVSPQFADAAFAAQANVLTGPVKIGPSWFVFRVSKVEQVAARTLDQVRGEIAAEITTRKTAQTFADLRQKIEDGIGDGKTFDEAVKDANLTAQRTPALTAQGVDPANPEAKPDPALAPIMRAGFTFEAAGDEPQLVPTSPDGGAALVSLERIVAAAPKPLAEIRADVLKDYGRDQQLAKARQIAAAMLPKLEKGMSMAQAVAEAGITRGAPPKPFDFKRSEIADKENFIKMAFAMAPKKAKLLEAPDRSGYYVVYLEAIEEHSAANDPLLLANARSALSQQVGPEIARQFIRAIRADLKITRNENAIKQLRESLLRSGVR